MSSEDQKGVWPKYPGVSVGFLCQMTQYSQGNTVQRGMGAAPPAYTCLPRVLCSCDDHMPGCGARVGSLEYCLRIKGQDIMAEDPASLS